MKKDDMFCIDATFDYILIKSCYKHASPKKEMEYAKRLLQIENGMRERFGNRRGNTLIRRMKGLR